MKNKILNQLEWFEREYTDHLFLNMERIEAYANYVLQETNKEIKTDIEERIKKRDKEYSLLSDESRKLHLSIDEEYKTLKSLLTKLP